MPKSILSGFCLSVLFLVLPGGAQESPPVDSRAEEIQAARREKSRKLEPDIPPKPERFLNYVKDNRIVERITGGVGGLRVRMGGVATAQGFALGPEYLRQDLANEQVTFRASAILTTRLGYLLDTEVDMPRLANDRMFVNLIAAYRNYPQVQYYGPGPDSSLNGRSNFRLEEASFTTRAGFRVAPPLRLGVMGSYMQINTGPGTRAQWASTEQIYNDRQAPGVDQQADFLQGGVFAHYDYRDRPVGARRGGSYMLQYSTYSDRTWGRYSFNRMQVDLRQYIPFLNERRVIALGARADMTDPRSGNRVPFYLQPTLGGSDDLRGYRAWRFYDNNAMVFNAEYRWEVFSGMDMAIFGDAGKVTPRWQDLNFQDLEASYGFGLRFNVRNAVFLRIDTAFSHEGFQVWFKFGNIF